MTEYSEDRVFARAPRRRGAVLIIGVGAVGSVTAQQLVRMGISPLWLVDYDTLQSENLARHVLGAPHVGQNKADALAEMIRRDAPWCVPVSIPENFLDMPEEEQLWLVHAADVVVAATDQGDCQRRINELCIREELPAVYPGVWVDPRVRDAEVGEILWVLPGRHTPCYECAFSFRQGAADVQAGRGQLVDIEQLALATAQVVAALLDPTDERSGILDPERTLIYVHGLSPTSPAIRAGFPIDGMLSPSIRVPFPRRPCRVCGGQEAPMPGLVAAPRPQVAAVREARPRPTAQPFAPWPTSSSRPHLLPELWLWLRRILALLIVAGAGAGLWLGVRAAISGVRSQGHAATSLAPSSTPSRAAPSPSISTSPRPSPSRSQVRAGTPTPKPPRARASVNLKAIRLECVLECGVINMQVAAQPMIELDVAGISARTLGHLCARGDLVRWSDNHGTDYQSLAPGFRLCGSQLDNLPGTNVASISLPVLQDADFKYVHGPWKITFRLISPSGRTLARATYQAIVR